MDNRKSNAERLKMQERLNKQYLEFTLNPIIETMFLTYMTDLQNNGVKDPVSISCLTLS